MSNKREEAEGRREGRVTGKLLFTNSGELAASREISATQD